jgi:hypothetical protein
MNWLKTPWSVQEVVRHDEYKWRTSNVYRKRLAFSRLEGELLFAGEHPFRFALTILVLQLALLLLVALLPSEWFSFPWGLWGVAERLSYFSTLWTVQATLVALVYPIVIAFVAVFLQRRPAAEALVHLYMLDSGALAVGLSSLALVVVMGVQYLMLTTWETTALPAWAALDTVWFLLNSALTTHFLFRTVEFLRPEVQKRVVQRYTINVALPREVARLYSFQVLAGAQSKGWLPVPAYGDDGVPAGPRLLIGQFSFREGDIQGELKLREPSRLFDVRIWLIRLAVTSWYRKAIRYPQPAEPRQYGVEKSWPLITLPVTPGAVFADELPLARVANGPPLAAWQRLMLRWALVLRPISQERHGIRVEAILGELAFDARQAASRGDSDSFERAESALLSLHELLLGACLNIDGRNKQGSWALLPDTDKVFGRTLHENWSAAYRPIFEAAIHNMTNDTRPLRRMCHLLQHLDGREFQRSPVEIQEHLLHLPPLMMYLLGNWWVQRIEEQGVMEHGFHGMFMLRPPLNRVYDEVLSSFVGGWENSRPNSTRRHRSSAQVDWDSASDLARLNARHIDETARMLLAAVHRGDQAAAEWLADVLSKWWGIFDYEREPYQLYDKTAFVTLDHLQLDWTNFKVTFGLADPEVQTTPELESVLQHGIYLASLKNYWTDIRLLVIELMMDWVIQSSDAPLENSLAIEIIAGLLAGKQWRGGGEGADPLNELSATNYLTAKIRQFAASGDMRGGYVGRLDRFVENVKSMSRPNMVSSRIYSFVGADDVESLQSAQLAFLAVLSVANWDVSRILQRQIDLWLEEKYASIEIVRNRLQAWLQRLDEEPELARELVALLSQRIRPGLDVLTAWNFVKAGLRSVQQAIEAKREGLLAAQPIDMARLQEIAHFASSTGFSGATGEFPMQFLSISTADGPQQDFTITLQKIRKGELTSIEMDQRASNESDFFAEVLARQVAISVLSDVIQRCNVREVVAADAAAYWQALKIEAAKVSARGGKPILLLDNATLPDWVWDWQHSDYGADYKRPDDLRVQRLDGRGQGYACDFNEIEVFVAPIPLGQSLLLSKDAFRSVTFTNYGDDRLVRVDVSELEEKKNLVDLKLTFSRRVEVGDTDAIRILYAQA